MEQWYSHTYRRSLVDMHIEAWSGEFLSLFDPQVYFECLKKAGVNGPMIYTHSHVGYTNWPSRSGEMHPGFKGERKIEKLFELCNAAGMEVIAYYSLIYNNWAYDHFPAWRMVDIDGVPTRGNIGGDVKNAMMEARGRYGLVCPNNAGYREFLKVQFAELREHFTFNGIFMDMTFWPRICFCGSCKARFLKETGAPLPEFLDWSDPAWQRFQAKREAWMADFAEFATREMKKAYPGVSVEHQFSTATHSWISGVTGEQAGASDYAGGDLYGGFDEQSLVCKLYYDITKNQPFEYMTSRCDPALHDHTTTKSLEMLKLHAYLTYAHHGAFLIIDAIDPRGTLNQRFYDVLGQVFDETRRYEPHFKGRLSADVALYFSFSSKLNDRVHTRVRAIAPPNASYPHLDATLGAAKALRRAHIPYRVTGAHALDRLAENRVIVLSDICNMSPREEDALFDYVTQGGSLYISGATSKNLMKRLLNLDVTGETTENVTYIRPTAESLTYFEGMYTRDAPMTVFGTQRLAKNSGGHTVLATVTLPYTDPQDLTRFASIHSNPPGIHTDHPAIIRGACGKGQVIWSAAAFESSEQPIHKQVFANLVGLLAPAPRITTDASHHIEFTVFEDEAAGVVQLHCVNLQEHFPMVPLPGFRVEMRCANPVKKIRRLPDGEEIPFETNGNYVCFDVASISIFAMFQLDV